MNHPMPHVTINLQGQKYCSICPLCHRCEGTSAGSHVNAAAVSKAPYAAIESSDIKVFFLCFIFCLFWGTVFSYNINDGIIIQ